MNDKEIKIMTLDLAKTISYLNELQKSNNQNYVTKEGLAFLEGVVLAGNNKVKVVPLQRHKEVINKLNDIIKQKKKPFFNFK